MKTLYFNCSAGISGDMCVGSLIDLTDGFEFLKAEITKLNLPNYEVKAAKIDKKGVSATKFDVLFNDEKNHRYLKDITALFDSSSLNDNVKAIAKKIFIELGNAESEVHKIPPELVHFHEVGAIDSIIDIVSTAILIDSLKVDKIYCSAISDGHGTVKFTHGTTDLPVPAVRILLKGFPMKILNINKELTTPTGAAIIKSLAVYLESPENLPVSKRGFGAGLRDLEIPNVLETMLADGDMTDDHMILLETNIDDMNPELYENSIRSLMDKGAKDAFIRPILMKKNRIGVLLSVMCSEQNKDKLIEAIFDETTTFGIRINNVHRAILDREIRDVETSLGKVRIKIGSYKGKVRSIKPEYEDCQKIADEKGVPLKDVYKEVNKHLDLKQN